MPKLLGTRQRHFKKILNLCRAPCQGHSAKYFLKKIFAERLTAATRQRRTWPNTVTRGSLCRVPRFCREPGTRQRSPLPSALFCRVPGTRQRTLLPSAILCRVRHSAKKVFAECPIFDTRQSSLHSAKIPFPVVSMVSVFVGCACLYIYVPSLYA